MRFALIEITARCGYRYIAHCFSDLFGTFFEPRFGSRNITVRLRPIPVPNSHLTHIDWIFFKFENFHELFIRRQMHRTIRAVLRDWSLGTVPFYKVEYGRTMTGWSEVGSFSGFPVFSFGSTSMKNCLD